MTENILQVSTEGRIGRQDISAFYLVPGIQSDNPLFFLLSCRIIHNIFCYPAG